MDPAKVDYDRFRVERQAGSGAMGIVYLAHDTLTLGKVALKVLRSTTEGDARRFLREARALAELNHPGIVRYVAHGESNGDRWLAMEWLEGETLGERLQRQGLTVAESVAVVARAADAVGALHQRGMLHRDLKPSNLFLVRGELDRVKVLDFGLARFGARSADMSMTGLLVGTPNYMSPEQAQGAKTVDSRADVFALGCVLFKCLTGHAPFHGPDAARVLAKLLFEAAPRLSSAMPNAPPELDSLLARTLSKDPSDRPMDASALARQLRALRGLDGDARTAAVVEGRGPALTGTEQRLFALMVAGESFSMSDEPTHVERRSADLTTAALLRTTVGVNGGSVEEQTEDVLVATFDAHGTPSDLAVQAARCALAVRAILPDVPISVSMGWARGRNGWRESEVTTRARLQVRAAKAAEARASIIVDRMVTNLLDARFDVTQEEPFSLRQERELAGPARTLLGKPSPCVGRERELTLLQSTYDEAVADSRPRVALVTSPAGGGKSRLRHELFIRLRERGDPAEVWSAHGDPMSAGSPFGLLAPAIRKLANILDGEPEIVRQQKLRARVCRYLREEDRARVTDFIGELAGVPMSDATSVVLRTARENPLTMGDQIARAFEDWLSAECDARPIILAIDDTQWGDWPSVRLVDGALRNLGNKPLFVLALARPELDDVMPELFKERDALTLRLGPIAKRAAETLARTMLGELANDATVARVVELAAGNVFYLEELIRAVAEGRGDALPDTVVAMVQQRTKALEPEARRVLRAASVFGQAFWRGGVLALLGGDRSEMLDDVLDELVSIELIVERAESRFPGDREYAFRHSLVRDGAYALLTEEDRRLGHELAANWLENSGEPNDRVLAEHFERGRQPTRAMSCWARAAEQALEGNDFAGAIEGCKRGETCGASGEARGKLALVAARAHRWRAELPELERAALLAMTLLPRHGREWLDAIGEAAPAACRLGHVDVLDTLAQQLRDVSPNGKRTPAFACAAGNLGVQLTWMGRRDAAKSLLALIDAGDKKEPLVEAWGHRLRGFIAQFEGDGPAYLLGSELAASAFERAGDRRLASSLQVSIGFALVTLGRYAEAEVRLREALAVAVRIGLPTIIALAKQNLGIALARGGRLAEGRRLETESAEEAFAQHDRRIESGSRGYLAEILIELGELDAAFAEATRSYDTSADPSKALALALMAEARRLQGRLDEALEHSVAAMDLLSRLGGIEEGSAYVRLVHAEVLFARGRAEEARAVIATAKDEIEARALKVGDEAAQKAFRECVPEHQRALRRAVEWG